MMDEPTAIITPGSDEESRIKNDCTGSTVRSSRIVTLMHNLVSSGSNNSSSAMAS